MKHFVGANRGQMTFMPYDLEEWLPQDHLGRFTIEIVDKLDFSRVYAQYRGTGTAAYDPNRTEAVASIFDILWLFNRRIQFKEDRSSNL